MKNILVVAAHPDDELLGVGGTIHKLSQSGHSAYSLIVAEGLTSRGETAASELESLREVCDQAGAMVGSKEIKFLNLPDNRLDGIELLTIVQKIEKVIEEISPDIVLTHHWGDLNIDHRIVFNAVITALRPIPNTKSVDIYCFETVSATEWGSFRSAEAFTPNFYVDIENSIDAKLKALGLYTSEMREYPHPRSIEGVKILAQKRGMEAGLRFAEAFELVRKTR